MIEVGFDTVQKNKTASRRRVAWARAEARWGRTRNHTSISCDDDHELPTRTATTAFVLQCSREQGTGGVAVWQCGSARRCGRGLLAILLGVASADVAQSGSRRRLSARITYTP